MRCFFSFLRQALKRLIIYRFEFGTRALYQLITLYGVKLLWITLSTQSPEIVGMPLEQMITYAMLAMLLDTIFYPSGDNAPHRYMAKQIKDGTIDVDLLKPIDYQLHMFYRTTGFVIAHLVSLVIPAYIFALLFMDMHGPITVANGILSIISLILGYLILFSLNFLLGIIGMITLDIKHISWAYNSLISFFSGKLVPLWLFPIWLLNFANILPFKYIYAVPVSIYIGNISYKEIFETQLLQCIWVIVLIWIGHLAWYKVRTRLIIQGG